MYSNLSITTKLEIFSIIEACSMLKTEEEFEKILKKINGVLGQEMTAYGIGNIRTLKVISNINIGFSADFMAAIVDPSGRMASPLFRLWLTQQTPQLVDFNNKKCPSIIDDLTVYRDFSLQNLMSHGVMGYNQQYMTYFGFAKVPERIGVHHSRLLEIFAPHLHVAYSRLISNKKPHYISLSTSHADLVCTQPKVIATLLSVREHEVLKWMSEGKTNWDISTILTISENTVKNHIKRILKKLEANNRQHAVAIAAGMGLITFQ